jgi:hypothetical protein
MTETDPHRYIRSLGDLIEGRVTDASDTINVVDTVISEEAQRGCLKLLKQAYKNVSHGDELRWLSEWLVETLHAKYLVVEAWDCTPTAYRCATPTGDALFGYCNGAYRLSIYCCSV